MKVISVIGIDLAKSVFHIYGTDRNGSVIKKRVRRVELLRTLASTPACLVGIEACGGSNYWAREFKKLGHQVRMIAPQYVKPFVKTNKNDFNDAEAIWDAVQRPNMRFVSEKTLEQQDIQMVHRIRSRIVRHRTGLCNEIRGYLAEYGIVAPMGLASLRTKLLNLLSDEKSPLNCRALAMIGELHSEWVSLENRIEKLDMEVTKIFDGSDFCRRISKIPGIGPITATAIEAGIGNPQAFKNGRQVSAFLGLVPRQHSTGGKATLLGISKRGDIYLRSLLIHGGRSVVQRAPLKTDSYSKWVTDKAARRGKNKAAVAVANKNARVIWKMMVTGEEYRPAV